MVVDLVIAMFIYPLTRKGRCKQVPAEIKRTIMQYHLWMKIIIESHMKTIYENW